MGLSISPAIFMFFITKVLDEIENRHNFIAIMDDIFVHSKRVEHLDCLRKLFKAIIKSGLKISPHKCQLFMKNVVYMGLHISYEQGHPTITPTVSKIEAINKITALETPSDVRGFCGMVNFLASFVKGLQGLMTPLYALTKKGKDFIWTDKCQESFDKVKKLLTKAPILSMPTVDGKYTLVSDTSKEATGAALYQEQQGKLRLVAYHSKKLKEAASRYSISELELHGLEINIKAFDHYLRGIHFDVILDHSALVYILKAKREPPTLRIKKILEHLSMYCFTAHFLKGKEMFVSDFLSRHVGSEKYTDEVLPVSLFSDATTAHDRYTEKELSAIATQMNKQSSQVAKEHQDHTGTDSDEDLENSQQNTSFNAVLTRSQAKRQAQTTTAQPVEIPKRVTRSTTATTGKPTTNIPDAEAKSPSTGMGIPLSVLEYAEKLERAQERPPVSGSGSQPHSAPVNLSDHLRAQREVQMDDTTIEERLRQGREAVALKRLVETRYEGPLHKHDAYQDTTGIDELWVRENKDLFGNANLDHVRYVHLPKQEKLTKHLESLKLKVINKYEVPMTIKEMTQQIKRDPYFGDIYTYITTGKLPQLKAGAELKSNIRQISQDYVTIEGVLFRLTWNKAKKEYQLLLCIPQNYLLTILMQYHNNLLSSHQGILRTYLTIREKYFVPYLLDNLTKYVACCRICQARAAEPNTHQAHHLRIPYNFRPMARVSIDLKDMHPSECQHRHILLICCEFSNYVIGIPLKSKTTVSIAEAILQRLVFIFGPPEQIISDADTAVLSNLNMEINRMLQIDVKVVSSSNHGSLRVERYIQTISKLIQAQLVGKGQQWHLFVEACCYAHNTFVTPTMDVSPYKMVFLHDPPALTNIKITDQFNSQLTHTARQYLDIMKDRMQTIYNLVQQKKLQAQQKQLERQRRLHVDKHVYAKGDLVYMYYPRLSDLQTSSKKFATRWMGPLQVTHILDDSHLILADLEGRELKLLGGAHINMVKPYVIHFGETKENRLVTHNNLFEIMKDRTKLPSLAI